jgi:integrase
MRDAVARRNWLAGELASMRAPDIHLLDAGSASPTLAEAAESWRSSRIDVAEGTAATYRVNLGRILTRLGRRSVGEIAPADVAALAGELAEAKLARESIRKTLVTFAMVLDYAGVVPNPVRDKAVKLSHELRPEVNPPTAEHVIAVHRLLPPKHRLPLLVLDATGMRVGEIEQLTWGDVDERRGRWRVSQAVAKTRRARWVSVAEPLFEAVARAEGERRPCSWGARVSGRYDRAATDGDHSRLHSRRRAGVLAARPPSSPDLAPSPRRGAVGSDRRAHGPTQPRRDREHVHARPGRRDRPAGASGSALPNRPGCVTQDLGDVLRLEVRVGHEDLALAHPVSHHSDDGRYRDPKAADAGDGPEQVGPHSDSLERHLASHRTGGTGRAWWRLERRVLMPHERTGGPSTTCANPCSCASSRSEWCIPR